MLIKFKDPQSFHKNILITGHTIRSFAEKVGISPPYMSQILNGKRYPSGKIAKKITTTMCKEFDELFFIDIVHKSDHR